MNSKYKDKLVGVYAPGSYDHTSVLGQTQAFSRWFWANHEDMEYICAKLGINAKKLKRIQDMLQWLEVGNIQCLQLQQIEPEKRMITISPKNFAKIDYYEVEEVEDEI